MAMFSPPMVYLYSITQKVAPAEDSYLMRLTLNLFQRI